MTAQAWSWLLAAVGIAAMWLAGRPSRAWLGWTVGITAQALWAAYAVATHQYGFLLSCTGYAVVYFLNLTRALRASAATDLQAAAARAGVESVDGVPA